MGYAKRTNVTGRACMRETMGWAGRGIREHIVVLIHNFCHSRGLKAHWSPYLIVWYIDLAEQIAWGNICLFLQTFHFVTYSLRRKYLDVMYTEVWLSGSVGGYLGGRAGGRRGEGSRIFRGGAAVGHQRGIWMDGWNLYINVQEKRQKKKERKKTIKLFFF